jgi:hypothetical protein
MLLGLLIWWSPCPLNKYAMRHPDTAQQHIQVLLDHKLYDALHQLEVVPSQYAFSRLLGRCQSYFSSLQCKKLPISAAALARLHQALREIAARETNVQRYYQLASVCVDLDSEIKERLL